ncbi:MAG: VanW family protein [Candidatus Pacebacteria bacterium]|nr:VanW family protein [Candidatus Paceibacterota bacterium]
MEKQKILKIMTGGLVALLFIFIAAVGVYSWLGNAYKDKIYPGVHLGDVDLSGKTVNQAKELVYQRLDLLNQEGISFAYGKEEIIIRPIIIFSPDADIKNVLIDFDVDKTVSNAMAMGRTGQFLPDLWERATFFFHHEAEAIASFNRNESIKYLKQGFATIEPADAKFYIDNNNSLAIEPEKAGRRLNYDKGLNELERKIKSFDFSLIRLSATNATNPDVFVADCAKVQDKAKAIADLAPISLSYGVKNWELDSKTLVSWLIVSKNNAQPEPALTISLDKDKIVAYLEGEVESQIEKEAAPPKFSVIGGSLRRIQFAQTGLELDLSLAADMLVSLPDNPFKKLNLSVKKLPTTDITIGAYLGIKEKIGGNTTQIIDSTQNRIDNIKNGAAAINGLVIEPDQEFSLLNALQPFDASNGYAKEIVIKDGVSTPDYGGGLCQLSTTLFRAVLDAGLPVTMRRNHSFWLPYYNPPGTDATIFEPSPDFRFVNDTGKYVLIQARVDENLNLIIDFWGTKDGRVVVKTDPVVYNIVRPGTVKMVKTRNLPSGQTSCPYPAYQGADAYFDYRVTYPDGTVKEQKFESHYIPRAKTCYVGI